VEAVGAPNIWFTRVPEAKAAKNRHELTQHS
jgi:hypothetical protein